MGMTKTALHNAVGFTTSIPVETVLAAGLKPIDLNNKFITHPRAAALVRQAEDLGLARTLCAWIKGIYAWCLEHPELERIVAVTQGDCSNTHALMELLSEAGRQVIPFDYPHSKEPQLLRSQLKKLATALGANLSEAEQVRRGLLTLRGDLARLDRMTWQEDLVSGHENQMWLLCASDFEGDPLKYHEDLKVFMRELAGRKPKKGKVRLGILGVPPIMNNLHEVLQELGGQVVFNEVPCQFAMLPWSDGPQDLIEQYTRYTYPYDVFGRVEDIARQIQTRRLDGLVHYTQTFCYRQMQDIILRKHLKIPMLTLEGDRVSPVDPRSRMRLEAFIDVLR
jgi:benzoyl-CoA reductase/2-hydroxyglutaryl-CoA dehydratase subunit BcrC/BadD/HgdB